MNEMTSRPSRDRHGKSCANAPCPRPAGPGDAYCDSCSLELSLFARRGGEADRGARRETDSGVFGRPGR